MNKKIKRWEIVGIVLIIGFGTTLHFWFEWTNYWRPVAVIAAVNESTWEHFKMAFWPSLVYALIEYPFLRNEVKNFLPAKAAAQITMPLVTMILFYGYTAVTGHHYLLADVLIFFLSVVSGQLVSLKILTSKVQLKAIFQRLAGVVLVLLIAAFSLLSYFPPKFFIFAHPEGGEYGILEDYDSHEDHDDSSLNQILS